MKKLLLLLLLAGSADSLMATKYRAYSCKDADTAEWSSSKKPTEKTIESKLGIDIIGEKKPDTYVLYSEKGLVENTGGKKCLTKAKKALNIK